jgi:hypothetical protein
MNHRAPTVSIPKIIRQYNSNPGKQSATLSKMIEMQDFIWIMKLLFIDHRQHFLINFSGKAENSGYRI